MYSVVMAAMLTAGAGSTTAWCHGCHGCHGFASCHGFRGSYVGCHGCSGCYGCRGCYGCYGSGSYCSGCFGCYGCSGCYGCCGGAVVYNSVCYGCCGGAVYSTPRPSTPATSAPVTSYGSPVPRTQTDDFRPQTARITVKLPESARLWVDDVNCPLTSNERSFNTPALSRGQQYFYTLRMEVEKDGTLVSEDRRVYVAAGQQVSVDFNEPASVTAQR